MLHLVQYDLTVTHYMNDPVKEPGKLRLVDAEDEDAARDKLDKWARDKSSDYGVTYDVTITDVSTVLT